MDQVSVAVWGAYAVFGLAIAVSGWFLIKKMNGPKPAVLKGGGGAKPLRTEKAASGLQSDIFREGTGPGAKGGDQLTVDYVLFLEDGQKIDSSADRGRSMVFRLGYCEVIEGWDKALKGAKVGEKRKITVPAKMAYGSAGSSKVPPGATLIFEVEILNIVAKK